MCDVRPHGDGVRSRPHPDRIIAELASRQARAVGRRQLLGSGISRGAIERRLASGHLHPYHRGVYAVGHATLGLTGRRHAALLAVEGSALAGRSAGSWWDLRADHRPIVEVVTRGAARSRRGIVVHRSRLDERDLVRSDGLVVTSAARTILDMCAERDDARAVELLERAEILGLLDVRALNDVCARSSGHRGLGRLQRALTLYDPRHVRTRSQLERRVIPLLDRAGVTRPEINARVGDYTVDLLWRDAGLVVEVDGWATHRTRHAFEADRERDRALALAGLTCVRVTARQWEQPQTVQDLATLVARRQALRRSPAW